MFRAKYRAPKARDAGGGGGRRGYGGMLSRKILKISVLSNDFSCILSPLLYHFD